jgi:hypothetical protein
MAVVELSGGCREARLEQGRPARTVLDFAFVKPVRARRYGDRIAPFLNSARNVGASVPDSVEPSALRRKPNAEPCTARVRNGVVGPVYQSYWNWPSSDVKSRRRTKPMPGLNAAPDGAGTRMRAAIATLHLHTIDKSSQTPCRVQSGQRGRPALLSSSAG